MINSNDVIRKILQQRKQAEFLGDSTSLISWTKQQGILISHDEAKALADRIDELNERCSGLEKQLDKKLTYVERCQLGKGK